jgi:hypothetical protein
VFVGKAPAVVQILSMVALTAVGRNNRVEPRWNSSAIPSVTTGTESGATCHALARAVAAGPLTAQLVTRRESPGGTSIEPFRDRCTHHWLVNDAASTYEKSVLVEKVWRRLFGCIFLRPFFWQMKNRLRGINRPDRKRQTLRGVHGTEFRIKLETGLVTTTPSVCLVKPTK